MAGLGSPQQRRPAIDRRQLAGIGGNQAGTSGSWMAPALGSQPAIGQSKRAVPSGAKKLPPALHLLQGAGPRNGVPPRGTPPPRSAQQQQQQQEQQQQRRQTKLTPPSLEDLSQRAQGGSPSPTRASPGATSRHLGVPSGSAMPQPAAPRSVVPRETPGTPRTPRESVAQRAQGGSPSPTRASPGATSRRLGVPSGSAMPQSAAPRSVVPRETPGTPRTPRESVAQLDGHLAIAQLNEHPANLSGMTYEQLKAEEAKILAELEELGYVESRDHPGKFAQRAVDQSMLQMSEDPIEVMFQTMDVDNSGALDASEIKALIAAERWDRQLDPAYIDGLMSAYDLDGSGDINLHELRKIYSVLERKLPQRPA